MSVYTCFNPVGNVSSSVIQIQYTLNTDIITKDLHFFNQHAGLFSFVLVTIITGSNLVDSRNDTQTDTRQSMLEEELHLLILVRLYHVQQRQTSGSSCCVTRNILIRHTGRSNTPQQVNIVVRICRNSIFYEGIASVVFLG